ncbi:MAG: ATP-dependent DNA helicase RecG [Lachnospiraceae bacterium]|nr:ATP-dependent DNA helicase RecG [Lachnospiraceae bacterium]
MLETRNKLTNVKGIGDVSAKRFEKLGITDVGGLITHYPFRYETYGLPIAVNKCRVGELVSVEGMVNSELRYITTGSYRICSTTLRDNTGVIGLRWYNAPYIKNQVKLGHKLIFRGKVTLKNGQLFLAHPEIFTREKYFEMLKNLKPVYKSTTGLNQTLIRKSIRTVFDELVLRDYLPQKLVKEFELPSLRDALEDIHFPKNEKVLGESLRRMVFDEFFTFFSNMELLKASETTKPNSCIINRSEISEKIINSLSWELTGDQKKALSEIFADMSGKSVMQRLLQGDVGSGKTIVALIALAEAAANGYQGCIMAPTEVLAEQHYEYFKKMLEPLGFRISFLKGSLSAKQKKEEYERISSGEADIVVGTHAALQDKVVFKNLALAVIDEQHRFGVKQREALEMKGRGVHLLLMSATPIPRTYALMLYGNMDISVLAELPADRKPIKNLVGDEAMREKIYRFIEKQIREGHQAYIICPLIEESDSLEAAAVEQYVLDLREKLPKDIVIDNLNGRMKADEKNRKMNDFSSGKTQILVSTTVIEVGINVPNATVMMIENAERFGLASLHQIRGRVGRGADQSYCIFMCSAENEEAKERLSIVAGSNDGFFIAGQDMKLRGPGDFFGLRQSGERQFVLADPLRDGEILKKARMAVDSLDIESIKELLNKRNIIVSNTEYMVY